MRKIKQEKKRKKNKRKEKEIRKTKRGEMKKKKRESCQRDGEERERKKKKNIFFASLKDLWKSDRRFLSEQKAKSVHASRATYRYQNLEVSSNSMR